VIITATSISYRCDLHTVESKIEEAGILLTAYLEVCTSQKEHHIRQRQKVLKALQAVVRATHEAIKDGRSALEQAPRRQQVLFTPRPARQAKRKGTSVSIPDDAETMAEQPSLRVVRAEEGQQ
jgi:phytoene/squalene synthetase